MRFRSGTFLGAVASALMLAPAAALGSQAGLIVPHVQPPQVVVPQPLSPGTQALGPGSLPSQAAPAPTNSVVAPQRSQAGGPREPRPLHDPEWCEGSSACLETQMRFVLDRWSSLVDESKGTSSRIAAVEDLLFRYQ